MSERSKGNGDTTGGGGPEELIISDFTKLTQVEKERIVKTLKGEEFESRFQVACQIEMAFETIPPKESSTLLEQLAKDVDPRIRQVALDTCYKYFDEIGWETLEKVLKLLAGDQETGIRAKVASFLMENIDILPSEAQDILEPLSEDISITVRNQVTEGLKRFWNTMPSEIREGILVGLLIDDNQLVRKYAGSIFAANFDTISEELREEFIDSISKEDIAIKTGVAEFLETDGGMSDGALTLLLPGLVTEKDDGVRNPIINYLVELIKRGERENLADILKMIVDVNDKGPLLSISSALVDEGVSPGRDIQELILTPLLQSRDASMRAGAAEVFVSGHALFGSDIVSEALKKLASDIDVNVRHGLASEVNDHFETMPKELREDLVMAFSCDHELWVRSRSIDILFLDNALESSAMNAMIRELAQDPDARVRRGVADKIPLKFDKIKKPLRDEVLSMMVLDEDVWVRTKAAEVLANYFARVPVELGDHLLKFAQDPNSFLRGKTARAIISNFVNLPFDIQNELLFLASDTDLEVINAIFEALNENFSGLPQKIKDELLDTFLSNENDVVKGRIIELFMVNYEHITAQKINEILGELVGNGSQKAFEYILAEITHRFDRVFEEPRVLLMELLGGNLATTDLKRGLMKILIDNYGKLTENERNILREFCKDDEMATSIADILRGEINQDALDAILNWVSQDVDQEVQRKAEREFDDIEI